MGTFGSEWRAHQQRVCVCGGGGAAFAFTRTDYTPFHSHLLLSCLNSGIYVLISLTNVLLAFGAKRNEGLKRQCHVRTRQQSMVL